MPESRCTTHSVRKPNASLPTVTWPENPPSKYFSSASSDARADALAQRLADVDILARNAKRHDRPPVAVADSTRRRERRPQSMHAMNRSRACQCDASGDGSNVLSAIARHRAASRAGAAPRTECASPRDISRPCGGRCRCRPRAACSTMVSSDSTSLGALGVDQLLDAVAHRLGRMRLAAVGRRDRRGEEIFQFEDAAAGRHVFVGGDARDRRFVHADGVGDGLEIERAQMLDAVREERVLLAHDLGRDFEDGLGALIERADQPGRGLQAFGEIGLVACRSSRSWQTSAW